MGLYGVPKVSGCSFKTFEDFFAACEESVESSLSWMLAELSVLAHKTKVEGLPGVGSTPEGPLVFGEDSCGVALAFPLSGAGKTHSGEVLIHWPTFLGNLERFMMQDYRGFLAFLYCFREVFFRRSAAFYEFFGRRLRQRLIEETCEVVENGIRTYEVAFLSETELAIYQSLLQNVINRPDTWILLDAACQLSFSLKPDLAQEKVPTPGQQVNVPRLVKERLCKKLELDPQECTLLKLGNYASTKASMTLGLRSVYIQGTVCGPSSLKGDLYELFFAYHCRHEATGVRRLDARTFALNLKEYLVFRTPFTKHYRNIFPTSIYCDPTRLPLELFQRWRALFENVLSAYAAVDFRRELTELWGLECLDYTLFVDSDAILRRLQAAARLEQTRVARTKDLKVVFAETQSRPPVVYEMESPDFQEEGFKSMKFKFIRRSNGVYWHPPWNIDHKYVVPPAKEVTSHIVLNRKGGIRSYAQPKLLKGVHYVPEYNEYFYTFDFLKGLDDMAFNPVRDVAGLQYWLLTQSTLSAPVLRSLMKRNRRTNAKASAASIKKWLHGDDWTEREDAAIIELYRPRMSDEVLETLKVSCYGRTPRDIARRADYLRRRMIEQGVYDITKFPLKNYSASLRKKLALLQQEAAAGDSDA